MNTKNLLERCLHELANLEDKLSKKELPGWEGTQRRILLNFDLKKAIKEIT